MSWTGVRLVRFFSTAKCWNLSWGSLNFYKVSLVCGYVPKSVLSRFSPMAIQRVWGPFSSFRWFCSPCPGLSAYYLTRRWMGLLPGPLTYGAASHNSHTGNLFVDRCQTLVVRREGRCGGRRDVSWSHDADATLLMTQFIEASPGRGN